MPRGFVDAMGNEIPYDGVSQLTWRVSANVVAYRAGKVLLIEPTYLGGKLELPGGEVEVGEILLEGAIRECWEETGHKFIPMDPVPTFVGEQFFCHKRGTSFRHSVFMAFVGQASDSPDPSWRAGEEDRNVKIHWMSPDELTADLLHPNHWAALLRTGAVNDLGLDAK